MKVLTILIPVYNEENTIAKLLKRVYKSRVTGYRKQVIVVDDCSTDQTPKILKKLRKKYGFKLLKHPKNRGKGAAIKTGLTKTSGNLVLTQDADLEYNPADYPALLKAYNAKKSPVVYGSRNMGTTKRGYLLTHLTGRALSFVFNLFYRSNITDINTGFKLIRADILKACDLKVDGFDFCHEVTAKILRMRYHVREVPITYNPRSWKEGKKVRPKDAFLDLWTTIKYRFAW